MLQSLLIQLGGLFGASVDWNCVNVFWRHRCLVEHRFTDHPIIAVRTVVGNESLVAKVPRDTLQGETSPELIRGEKLVKGLGSRSARERNPKSVLRRQHS